MLNKKKIEKFGEHYLLGVNEEGRKVYLEKPSWDCGWYWGFGYLHTFTNERSPERSKDIDSHFHFDHTFLRSDRSNFEWFKTYFKDTVLTDDEIWQLLDLMASAYSLKKAAAVMYRGDSNYTSKAKVPELRDDQTCDKINHVMLPAVFSKIRELLEPTE